MNKIVYLILMQSDANIRCVFATTNKVKRDDYWNKNNLENKDFEKDGAFYYKDQQRLS